MFGGLSGPPAINIGQISAKKSCNHVIQSAKPKRIFSYIIITSFTHSVSFAEWASSRAADPSKQRSQNFVIDPKGVIFVSIKRDTFISLLFGPQKHVHPKRDAAVLDEDYTCNKKR